MHCHTTRSDGSDSPEYVIRLARQMGLSALAITDHDYYAADYDAEGLGRSLGMRVINGVECSTFDFSRGHKVHILCYNIKHPDAVEGLLARITRNRTEAALAMLKKVSKLYPITEEMVMDENGTSFEQNLAFVVRKDVDIELARKYANRPVVVYAWAVDGNRHAIGTKSYPAYLVISDRYQGLDTREVAVTVGYRSKTRLLK